MLDSLPKASSQPETTVCRWADIYLVSQIPFKFAELLLDLLGLTLFLEERIIAAFDLFYL